MKTFKDMMDLYYNKNIIEICDDNNYSEYLKQIKDKTYGNKTSASHSPYIILTILMIISNSMKDTIQYETIVL